MCNGNLKWMYSVWSTFGSIHCSKLKLVYRWLLGPNVLTDLHLKMTEWYLVMGISRTELQFVCVSRGLSLGTSRKLSGLYASLIDSSKNSWLLSLLLNELVKDTSGSSNGDHSSTLLSSSSKFSNFKRAYSSCISTTVGVLGLEISHDSLSIDLCRS